MSSLISLFSGLQLSIKMPLASFVIFISRYFIVFEDFVNETVSLISFLVYLLLVYSKPTHFCMLTLYTATLLKEFMICNSFF
jgi:hypothetical protein